MKRARLTLLVTAACVAVGTGLLAGQSTPPQDTAQPTFRAAVEAVQLTVVVTDRDGNPVAGLTASDFEILENGVPRPITTFSAVDLPAGVAEAPGRSDVVHNDRPPGRTYLIALDDMPGEQALRARWFLRQFLERHFGPNDTAAVVLTTRGPRDSGQDFTGDVRLLLNAIDRFGGGEIDFGRVNNVMSSLRELTEALAKLPGRKALIFVSRSLGSGDSCGCDPYRLVGYRPGPLGGLFSDIHPDFHRAISAATRGNVAIYPVNPDGLRTELIAAGSFDTSEMDDRMGLSGLAAVTGGFALTNSNNYEGAFERLVREQSTYYLLGFSAADERRDGRWVGLQVRVKRPDLQVRTLDGYVAPRSRPERPRTSGTLLAAVREAVASPVAMSGVPLRVFAAPFKGRTRNATVGLAVDVAASKLDLVEQNGTRRGELELLLAVTDSKSRRWPMMRHRAALALKPESYERVTRSGLRVLSQLTLPKGRYQVRVSAGDSRVAGSVVYDIEVPDFGDDLAMSGIVVGSTGAERALTVTSHPRLDAPLLAAASTAREFTRDETLALFVEVYENRRKPHTIDVTTELRDAGGRVLGASTVRQETPERPKGESAYAFRQNLVLDEVPPGRYTVRMQARSSLDDGPRATREVAITVR